MMFIIEFKPDIILDVGDLVLQYQGVLLELDLVQVQGVELLPEIVYLGLVKLLDLVVVLLQAAGLVHYLFAYVVAIFLMAMFHRDELASQHLDLFTALLQLVQQGLEHVLV